MTDEIDALKRAIANLEGDAEWRRRWHERLGRGNLTEGRFYEMLESQCDPEPKCPVGIHSVDVGYPCPECAKEPKNTKSLTAKVANEA